MIPLHSLHGRWVSSLRDNERIVFDLAAARGYAITEYGRVFVRSECSCKGGGR